MNEPTYALLGSPPVWEEIGAASSFVKVAISGKECRAGSKNQQDCRFEIQYVARTAWEVEGTIDVVRVEGHMQMAEAGILEEAHDEVNVSHSVEAQANGVVEEVVDQGAGMVIHYVSNTLDMEEARAVRTGEGHANSSQEEVDLLVRREHGSSHGCTVVEDAEDEGGEGSHKDSLGLAVGVTSFRGTPLFGLVIRL